MTKTAAAVGTVVRAGSWILQNPLVSGYSATEAYLPARRSPSPWSRPSSLERSILRG
jgi:hypothetical protein